MPRIKIGPRRSRGPHLGELRAFGLEPYRFDICWNGCKWEASIDDVVGFSESSPWEAVGAALKLLPPWEATLRAHRLGEPSQRATESLDEPAVIDGDRPLAASLTFSFEGPLVATVPHECFRCAGTIGIGETWWETGTRVACDPCKQEIIEALEGTQS